MQSPDLKSRILAAARRSPSATRREAGKQTALVVLVAITVDLGLFELIGGMHRGARPTPFLLMALSGSAAIALLATWAAFGRGRSMLGRPPGWLLGIALVTPLALFAWLLLCNSCYLETLQAEQRRIGVRCLGLTLGLSVWPLGLLAIARREKIPNYSGVTGAARGVAVGAVAWVLVTLWCPLSNPAHLAVGHLLPLVVLAGCGAWIGRRFSGVRLATKVICTNRMGPRAAGPSEARRPPTG